MEGESYACPACAVEFNVPKAVLAGFRGTQAQMPTMGVWPRALGVLSFVAIGFMFVTLAGRIGNTTSKIAGARFEDGLMSNLMLIGETKIFFDVLDVKSGVSEIDTSMRSVGVDVVDFKSNRVLYSEKVYKSKYPTGDLYLFTLRDDVNAEIVVLKIHKN
jgi:hypothetical protein